MLTWLLYGYLALSMLTFLFVYAAYVAAARADGVQEQPTTKLIVSHRPTHTLSIPAEALSLSTV